MNKTAALVFLLPLTLFSCGKHVRVNVINSDVNKGDVTQGGSFAVKSTVILEAKPKEGYLFTGWYNNNAALSFQNPYIYIVPEQDITITAVWEEYSTQTFNFDKNIDNSWTISHYYGSSQNVVIPKTHYGINVTAIGDATFSHEHSIQTINIHDEIVKIGKYAFEDVLISSITLPKSLKEVGDAAFISWKENQTINIHKDSSMLAPLRTKWGWDLNEVSGQDYYTCSKSGAAHIKLI